jgi:hypothetical protein
MNSSFVSSKRLRENRDKQRGAVRSGEIGRVKNEKKYNLTPGKRFELLRCRAPSVFKTDAFPG